MRAIVWVGFVAVMLVADCLPGVRTLVAADLDPTTVYERFEKLKRIGLALHNYAAANGHFPPAVVVDKKSGVARSWRVEILPYLEGADLYNRYHKDEPWDSEYNKQLIGEMPEVYRFPKDDSDNAAYFVPIGKGTIFGDAKGCRLATITDGLANTVLLVEAKREIPWTKPEDIKIDGDTSKPLPKFGGFDSSSRFGIAMADGSATLYSNKRTKTLRKLLTKNGKEEISDKDGP